MEFGLRANVMAVPPANRGPPRPPRKHDRNSNDAPNQPNEQKILHATTPSAHDPAASPVDQGLGGRVGRRVSP
ncbi:hypothetical protein GCM10022251_50860 [Phytohabitans flavus]|uniref:Uncharacterized protein n=1 Tax=Phytohabitans flavus TaxID=1076124 RepID=A0A6F8XS72_9ACTN|nr:hypothetical protein Pflav_030490 [Phytohabitans flavus]